MSRLRLLPLAAALILAACGDDAADAPGADAPAAEAPGTANPLDPGASPGQALTDDEAALASYTLTMERVERSEERRVGKACRSRSPQCTDKYAWTHRR